jgi:hypothetical protein
MALSADSEDTRTACGVRRRPGVIDEFIGWGPIPAPFTVAEPMMAMFGHFMHDGIAQYFALKEDPEAG